MRYISATKWALASLRWHASRSVGEDFIRAMAAEARKAAVDISKSYDAWTELTGAAVSL